MQAETAATERQRRTYELMKAGQAKLVAAFERVDGGSFTSHSWERPGGGGGTARMLEQGGVFERAGINVSAVYGKRAPASLAKQHPKAAGQPFFATGISLVLHPQNPYVPSFHANYRYFEAGGVFWFGGGADLTPSYLFEEDVRGFHRELRAQCERHGVSYSTLKKICDDYFFIKHRQEMRGVGGIFFDELELPGETDFKRGLAFAADGIDTVLTAYLPLVAKRKDTPFGELERRWQLYRRGRYVEFNLVYDRGTLFGLQTSGNIEAILMSLPPHAHWMFDYHPEPGSEEARMLEALQPRDWA
jgi:coproporphyrinogen III oxidase